MAFLVSSNYATIKMYDSIPLPFFLTIPLMSFVICVIFQIMFPYAAKVYDNSSKSLFLLKSLKIVATEKLWLKTIKATRPPRFKVGSMFFCRAVYKKNLLHLLFK